MAMNKFFAAAAGAVAFQAIAGLFASPARAAWGWQLTVPDDAGYTCSEGTTIGCASFQGCTAANFTCTVVPDTGLTCDVTSTDVVCSLPDGAQNFVPVSSDPMCVNVESHANYNNATLSWNPVPTCTNSTSSNTCRQMVSIGAAVGLAQLF
mmetsp:Transcript_28742/g.35216  ORF Transcript_28742/g.35216 Transcript_28742/m.35216 type:complete len:151 (-) Transcript_28742:260-712(-)|eukprot:CAMPEP_0114648412 /NCGR_PEP_ID=MMETSP0191-20121206/6397_1 /TAXON_ID=126664 /ORGANISM="Sorites sp." /LENGTH=150 /DNA_ID=CAMNT_0001861759 /DNA_START=73 /DNA_END=525 /DNA_ORIENTATION=-